MLYSLFAKQLLQTLFQILILSGNLYIQPFNLPIRIDEYRTGNTLYLVCLPYLRNTVWQDVHYISERIPEFWFLCRTSPLFRIFINTYC